MNDNRVLVTGGRRLPQIESRNKLADNNGSHFVDDGHLGLVQEQLGNPWLATLVMGLRMFAWTFASLGGIAAVPLWLLAPLVDVPLTIRGMILVSSVLYFMVYLYGVM